jgi:hypothetical protein
MSLQMSCCGTSFPAADGLLSVLWCCSVRTGPTSLNRWRVSVPYSLRDRLALINASLVPDIAAAAADPDPTTWGSASSGDVSGQQLVVGLATTSSVPLSGVYRLALGEVCDSVELNTTDDEDTVRAKLNTLPNVTGGHTLWPQWVAREAHEVGCFQAAAPCCFAAWVLTP